MNIHPSLARYQQLRPQLEKYPADRDGMKMNLEGIELPGFNGTISGGSRIDSDPATHDILNFASDSEKGSFRYENFVELPPTQTFWGNPKTPPTLAHLSRRITHVPAGQSLSELVLCTIDLNTGKAIGEYHGSAALQEARKLEDSIPFRLHMSEAFLGSALEQR